MLPVFCTVVKGHAVDKLKIIKLIDLRPYFGTMVVEV